MQAQSQLQLLEVCQKAPNRRKLYDILQKVYDLPNYGPMITTEYLREIMKAEAKFIKVKREETYTIPKGVKRNFNSIQTLHQLVRTLKKKNKKECGFTSYCVPNLEWMLRMIIWADPEQRKIIFKKSIDDRSDHRKVLLEDQYIQIDPQIKLIFDDVAPCRSVNNQNYRMYMDSFGDEEQKRISNVNDRLKASQAKAIKLKIQMERALQNQEDQKQLLLIYQQELELKKKKKQIQVNKKLLRKRTMESLLNGKIPQTPLVQKFMKLQFGSQSQQRAPQQNLLNQFDAGEEQKEIDFNQPPMIFDKPIHDSNLQDQFRMCQEIIPKPTKRKSKRREENRLRKQKQEATKRQSKMETEDIRIKNKDTS